MRVAMILALQAAPSVPADFDLKTYRPSDAEQASALRCRGRDPDEIVVCGRRRSEPYPMEEMERRYATKPLIAETGIAPNTSIRAYTESVEFPGGQISKRALIGVKLRF